MLVIRLDVECLLVHLDSKVATAGLLVHDPQNRSDPTLPDYVLRFAGTARDAALGLDVLLIALGRKA